MEFRLLGPLEVLDGEALLPLAGGKQRALFADLLLHANRAVSVERLVDDLWGDEVPDTAVKAIQIHVSRLRKLLPEGRLLTRGPGYLIVVQDGELDLDRFERLVAEGRRAAGGDLPEAAASLLRSALDLWRGPALEEFAEPFARPEAARLEELRLSTLEERIEADLAAGRHGDLVGELESLVAREPLREGLRAQHMLALYRSGRQAAALSAYQEYRRHLADELGIEPSRRLKELERRILQQDPVLEPGVPLEAVPPEREAGPVRASASARGPATAAAPPPLSGGLPVPPTSFLGRERELADLVSLLRSDETRLLTLTGPGGVGKTRLAVEAAARARAAYGGAAHWIPLGALRDPGLVVPSVVAALGADREPDEQVGERRLLVVLDNMEHLTAAAGELAELLAARTGLVLLVTSRERLRLAVEREFQVRPLTAAEGVGLFLERAPGLSSAAAAGPAVAAICKRLDHLPLALELAAARTRVLGPEELRERLERRLPVLGAGPVDASERHRTLHDTVAWSYELLEPRERELFRQLSVFAGGWTLEAAEAVAGADLELLESLVDKSLVTRLDERLALLETIRDFGLEQLAAAREHDEVSLRHARYYLELTERAAPELAGAAQEAWLIRLLPERANLRAARECLVAAGEDILALRLALAAARFWLAVGPLAEGRRWLDGALEAGDDLPVPLRAEALRQVSNFAMKQRDEAVGREAAAKSIELFREAGDTLGVAWGLNNLANMLALLGELEDAEDGYEESLELFESLGLRGQAGAVVGNLGYLALWRGAPERGIELLEEALGRSPAPDNRAGILATLALARIEQGRVDAARTLLDDSLVLALRIGSDERAAYATGGLGLLAAATRRDEQAVELLVSANVQLAAAGARPSQYEQRLYDDAIERLRARLGPARFDAASAAGTVLRADGVRALLASPAAPSPHPRSPVRRAGRAPVLYAKSGELNIAFQVTGAGPVDVVLVPGFVSHLEKDWEEPRHVRFLDRLSSFSRLIRFDKRGTGLSDRPQGLPDLETRMDDVRAVMDAAGSERAIVLGYSEGGPMALLFSASYPERVRGLVLYGAYAKRIDPDADYPWAPTREERRTYIEQLEQEWAFEADMKIMCPSADDAMASWWGERSRAAASPGAVRELMEMNSRIDVRAILPTIHVPTLVVHRGTDFDVRVEEGRYIAERIPGARFVELAGADHFVAVDPDQILDVVEPFVTELGGQPVRPVPVDDRVLATLLVSDIVGSTETAARLGDRVWADLLSRHDTAVREELARYSGEEVATTGDGMLALFDGPARAVRAGLAISSRVAELGLRTRVGLHTGEVERRGRDVLGIAVHVATRVAGHAAAGEVVVTATTRDIVAGSGLAFEDCGEHVLKGLDEPRRLYVALDGAELSSVA